MKNEIQNDDGHQSNRVSRLRDPHACGAGVVDVDIRRHSGCSGDSYGPIVWRNGFRQSYADLVRPKHCGSRRATRYLHSPLCLRRHRLRCSSLSYVVWGDECAWLVYCAALSIDRVRVWGFPVRETKDGLANLTLAARMLSYRFWLLKS